jgi:hypothetical protein
MSTYPEIKKQLLDEWEHITEDDLPEIADGLVPVYYSGILEEWRDLSMSDTDTWQETLGDLTQETTIFNLMSCDLYNYYMKEVAEAYREIEEEKQEQENEREEQNGTISQAS